jgi:phage-related protein
MTQPGRAAIEIIGDASKLGPQLERDAQRAIDNVDIDTTSISKQISDGFGEGVDNAITKLSELDPAVVLSSRNFVNRFTDAADEVTDAFDEIDAHFARTSRNVERNSRRMFDGIERDSDTAGDAVSGLGRLIISTFSRIGNVLADVGGSIAESVTSIVNPSSLITLGAQVLAYTALTTVIVGLGAALADLAGLLTVLPAAIGTAGAAITVLVVAFQGFGDAISAVLDGDPEKIAEAMERLAPAAREVVKEFQAVLPLFQRVGDAIQQSFFEPLVGLVETFGTRTLPRLRNELDTLAQALGRMFGNFGDLVNDAENVGILERTLAATARITDTLGASFATLGQALLNALDAGLPSLERLTGGIAGAIDGFSRFINESIEDGSFQAFFEEAIDTLGRLLDLGGAVGELLGVIFGGTDEAGRDFITTLTDVTQRLTQFFKSAEGQRVLERMSDTLGLIGSIIGGVINAFVLLAEAGNAVEDAFSAVIDFFDRAGNDIGRFWDGLVTTVSDAVTSVGDFFSDLGATIATVWEGITDGVSSAINSVVTFFQELPGRILAFIESIPDRVAAVFDAMIDRVIEIFALGIAAIIVFFTDLPGQVFAATTALVQLVTDKFNELRANIETAINAVVTFFSELPAKLGEIGTSILAWAEETWNSFTTTIGEAIDTVIEFVASLPGRFREFFDQARTAVQDRVSAIVEFVKGVPGRILSALGNVGTLLLDSGKKIIQGLIDGITSRLGQLRDKIVEAVGLIRDHLPFSPAKTGPLSGSGSPQIAGAVIAEMIAAGLDAGTPLLAQAAGRAAAAASPFGAVGQAGVAPLAAPGAPGGPSPVLSPTQTATSEQAVFIVQIGNEEIEAFIDKRVDARVDVEVRRLMAGDRGF